MVSQIVTNNELIGYSHMASVAAPIYVHVTCVIVAHLNLTQFSRPALLLNGLL